MRKWFGRIASGPADDLEWQRIAGLNVAGSREFKQVWIGTDRSFQRIKLRSLGADIDVYHWILEFQDGTILDLSVNCLLEGSESVPMSISGRRLTRVAVKFDARRVRRRGRLEIWAQA